MAFPVSYTVTRINTVYTLCCRSFLSIELPLGYPVGLAPEAKADTILMKPFDLEELDESMDKLLVHRIR